MTPPIGLTALLLSLSAVDVAMALLATSPVVTAGAFCAAGFLVGLTVAAWTFWFIGRHA